MRKSNSKLDPKNFTKFKLSKPFGYYPPDVDSTVDEYENLLKELRRMVDEKDAEIESRDSKIRGLENELRDLHIQFASMELPDVEPEVQKAIFKSFKTEESGGTSEKEITVSNPNSRKSLKKHKTPIIAHKQDEKDQENENYSVLGSDIKPDFTNPVNNQEDDIFKIIT